MDLIFWIGTVAACLTTASFLPQVIKAHTSRHTKDLSLMMFGLFSLGLAMWIVYGLALRSIPVIAANTVTLGLTGYIIFLKIKYG
ncbi:MAG: SemiSWEET transporter [Candidatus Saganbacteria bacterium]|nr:SemiSWEET transporter [Candidatus Saganbacteria bacterium]